MALADMARRADWGRWAWPALAVALASLAVGGAASTSRIFFVGDLATWFWPEHLWLRETLAAGLSPLWDPYYAFGQPAIGDPVRMMLHPTVLLRLALPDVLGFNLVCALPFPLAALGAYLFFARHATRSGAALGAIAFALSGPVLSTGNWISFSWAVVALPWALLAVDRLAERPRPTAVAAVTIVFALQLLGAEAVTLVGTAALAVAYAGFGPTVAGLGWRPRATAVALTVFGGVAAVALAAAQVLPAAETARLSWRAVGFDATIASLNPLHPLMLFEALSPRLYGDPFSIVEWNTPWLAPVDLYLQSVYVGAGAVTLAAIGAAVRGRWTRFWLFVLVVVIVCALGRRTPVYPALQAVVPLLRGLRAPAKYTVLASFALAALVASGWDALVKARGAAVAVGLGVAVAVGAAATLLFVAAVAAPGSFHAAGAALGSFWGVHDPDEGARFLAGRALTAAPRLAALAFGAAVCVWTGASGHRRAALARVAVFGLVAADLLVSNAALNPTDEVWLYREPSWIAAAREHPSERFYVGGRIAMMLPGVADPDLAEIKQETSYVEHSQAALAGFYRVNLALMPSAWRMREAITYDATASTQAPYVGMLWHFRGERLEARAAFLGNTGIRYYLLGHPPFSGGQLLAPMSEMAPMALYEGPAPRPRAAVVPVAVVEPDPMRQITPLFDPTFDAGTTALVEREPAVATGRVGEPRAPAARIAEDLPTRVSIEAAAPEGGGYLVLTDSYAPGWHAEVDGSPAEIVRANGLFRAVRLAPGEHRVVMRYEPRSFSVGLAVSLLTAALLAAISAQGALRRLYSRFMRQTRAATLLLLLAAVFAPAAPPAAAADAPTDQAARRDTFETVWRIVNERFYDPNFNGVDWKAVRVRYAPLVDAVKSDAELYPLLNTMLGELKASHFSVKPPGANDDPVSDDANDPSWGGGVGLTARIVEGRVTITAVEPDGPADAAGLRPGFVLTRIGSVDLGDIERRAASATDSPVMASLRARRAVATMLGGMPGKKVDVAYLDAKNTPRTASVVRAEILGKPLRFGELPTVISQIESKRLEGGIGYLRFNIWLPAMLEEIRAAIRSFGDAPAIVIDLRNNPGGVGAMAPSIAALFLDRETNLGTMRLRRGELRFVAYGRDGAYAGPLVLLVDEGTASTSEIFAGTLQESGRGAVAGQPSVGAVLPSVIEKLPNGAILQYAVADFTTPKGVLLEGRGVLPDLAVPLRRADYLAGRDPVLDAALAHIRQVRSR